MLVLCCFHKFNFISFHFILFYYLCSMWQPLHTFLHIFFSLMYFFSLFFFFLQLLAKIYKMPLKPIFLSGRLVNLPRRVQEQSASSEDGIECILSDFDDDTGKCTESSKWGMNRLLPPHVTINFASCQKQKGKGKAFHSLLSLLSTHTHKPPHTQLGTCQHPYVKRYSSYMRKIQPVSWDKVITL